MSRRKLSLVALVLVLSGCTDGAVTAGVGAAASAAPTPGLMPTQVIAERVQLMKQMEGLMLPIDSAQGQGAVDTTPLRTNAVALAAMLRKLPQLFPATTNLYDANAEVPATVALPAIWQDFAAFSALADAAATAAQGVAAAEGRDKQRGASALLRGSCDACHARFLRKYEQSQSQASDAEFDFDSALPGK